MRLLFLPEGRELEAEWPGLTRTQRFSGKAGRVRLMAGSRGMALAVGLGDAEKLDMDCFRAAVGTAMRTAASQEIETLSVDGEQIASLPLEGDPLAELSIAATLAAYRFVAFKSEPGEEDCPASLLLWSPEQDLPGRVDKEIGRAHV